MEIRFHLDEHIDRAGAEGLRRRGVDVTTTIDADLAGAPDEEQLAYATSEGRVFVTRDVGFLAKHQSGLRHAGIAFCHSKQHNVGKLVLSLVLLWRVVTAEEMQGHVEFL